MAETTILSVVSTVGSKLPDLPILNGQLIIVKDKHKIAIDLDDKRVIYNEIHDLETEEERTALLAPVSGIYYFVVETSVLWTYRAGWIQITTPPSENTSIESLEQTVVTTEDGGENVWTATMSNGTTSNLVVLNGRRGSTGNSGVYVGSDEPEDEGINLWIDPYGATSAGLPMVFCWGDSLTQGVGGNVNGWHLMSYPQELSQRCNAVNLGVLSEDVPTIQSRIGADKVLLPACVIPGDHTQGVAIGTVGQGLTTESGRKSHILRYGEAGVNPCYINGVKCILYRNYTGSAVDGTTYYLRRFDDGADVTVEEGTPLVTFGAKHYQGGLHIFWMGANGGYGNLTDTGTDLAFGDYVARLKACVEAVNPDDYLIVYARERVGYSQDEPGDKAALAEIFNGHFVDLLPALQDRGLMYAETSLWDGSLTNGVPSVLDSGDGCHYSFYGYKAIAHVLWEYVWPKLAAIKNIVAVGGGSGDQGNTDAVTGDEFGEWLYKLQAPRTLTASSSGIETGFAPFAVENDEWTFAVRVAANAQRSNESVNLPVFWMQKWFYDADNNAKGLAFACYADPDSSMPNTYMLEGLNAFKIDVDSMGLTPSEDGYHTFIVARSGSQYWNYLDGQLIYGTSLGYDTTGYTCADTVKVGYCDDNTKLIGEINDIRIYDTCLTPEQCVALNATMTGQ